ncbi:hypothetical protein, partial [Pantoea sp. AS142]|uniref:hypothetical protein n=1 Tax=Pantoea sp. AS142 TaxID=3081292 RepID=UPI003019B862
YITRSSCRVNLYFRSFSPAAQSPAPLNPFPVAGVPCQWRRIIGNGSDSAIVNFNFFTNRSIYTQKTQEISKKPQESKKNGPKARFFDSSCY